MENQINGLRCVCGWHVVHGMVLRGVRMNTSSEVANWLLCFYGGVALILWVMK
jgi:hypothetical protein